ncbi:response regulator [Solimonas soli]|uniref:response regulator n=1 Tax=Solimonas soli TaxID=413479 RepID=UPI000487FEA5|nr:response regulator [Solimonas soli]
MSTRPPHILLVEDEPGTLMTTAILLEMSGYRVSKAPNGRRGLELFVAEAPDLVVTDYMMPHMDGLQLIEAIRAAGERASTPILLMSSGLPPEVSPTLADAFIRKPFEYTEFERAVVRLLKAR